MATMTSSPNQINLRNIYLSLKLFSDTIYYITTFSAESSGPSQAVSDKDPRWRDESGQEIRRESSPGASRSLVQRQERS